MKAIKDRREAVTFKRTFELQKESSSVKILDAASLPARQRKVTPLFAVQNKSIEQYLPQVSHPEMLDSSARGKEKKKKSKERNVS